MKKLFLATAILLIAVFASAYTVRHTYQMIQLETLSILDYVDPMAPAHDADFQLSVTDGIDVVSTTTHGANLIRVCRSQGPTGPAAYAWFDAQAFTTPGPSAGVVWTITLTYLPNLDEATRTAVMSYTQPTGTAAVFRYGADTWTLPDTIILGSAAPTPTYTVNMSTNPEGYITPTTLGPTEDVTTIYGTYTPTPLPTPATGYWTPASLTIDENTQWTADGDNFVLNQEFVWTETYPTIYNLYVRGELGYAVTGPVSGTIEYDASNADVTALVGDYTVAAAPEGYHWEVNPISVVATDFVEEQPGAKSVRAQRIFNHTITFVLVEDTPPPAYTITITAADAETNEPLVANIYIDGVDSGYLTPYTFTEGVDYTPGVYTVVLDGYTDWIPESVTFPAVLTHDYTTNFIGTREQVTPVELSSFSATLTANLFVKLTWVSQTETNMVGYKVYRGTSANIADAEMLDIPMVPATNTSSSATYTVTDSNVLENNTYYYWLETIDYHETQFFGPTSVFVESAPPVTNQTKIVKSGPNPFKIGDTYNIQLDVKTGETGTVTIYNVIGQVVRTYSVTGGSNQLVKWDGKDSRGNTCGSGIYFYKLSTPSVNQSKKIVVVK
jgi:hypothetical protein